MYLPVRFGNVLGSRGSVLTSFHQIGNGGPVTVTDPEVTRFFMTIPEAVQLVVQAGAIGRAGEVLVLDMGDPIRIADVARRLIAQSGKPIEVVFTGLRPGEKLHEELFGTEVDKRPSHQLTSHVPVPPLDPDDLRQTTGHP
ncbi:MAG: polysaccharide biosynthesis protein [Ilumatobacteraceae bacterium]